MMINHLKSETRQGLKITAIPATSILSQKAEAGCATKLCLMGKAASFYTVDSLKSCFPH